MSGLELVGLVAGIVSAFSGTASYLQDRRKRKAAERKAKEEQRLKDSLALGPQHVQGEYDRDFARFGPKFATGDNISRHALSTILINMQQKLIGTLIVLRDSDAAAMPDIDFASMLRTSDSSRTESITTLAQQYQRFSTAAPISDNPTSIPPSSSPSGHGFCAGAIMLLEDNDPKRTLDENSCKGKWTCPVCHQNIRAANPKHVPARIRYRFLLAQHMKGPDIMNGCSICWQTSGKWVGRMSGKEWMKHFKSYLDLGMHICVDPNGLQQRRVDCTNSNCQGIHA